MKSFFALIGLLVTMVIWGFPSTSWCADKPNPKKIPQIKKNMTELETIMRAGKELTSENEELRLGAAKILGKYSQSMARIFLLKALDDKSTRVRRAAAISILEKIKYIDLRGYEKFLSKIDDPDAEIRRSVSSSILYVGGRLTRLKRDEMLRSAPAKGMLYRKINRIQYTLPASNKEKVEAAFFDADPIVRINIIKSFRSLGIKLNSDLLERLLKDENEKVIVQAMKLINSIPMNPAIIEQLKTIADKASVSVKQQLALSAADIRDKKIVPIIEKLSLNKDPMIQLISNISLALLIRPVDSKRVKQITRAFLDIEKDSPVLVTMMYKIGGIGDKSIDIYRELTKHKKERLRMIAWSMYLRFPNILNDSDKWMHGLSDHSLQVRQEIIRTINRIKDILPSHVLEEMIKSPYTDVRINVVRLLQKFPPKDLSQLAFKLLIDDQVQVRINILTLITKRRIGNWRRILQRTLQDSNKKLQDHAINLLIQTGTEGKKILESFALKNPDLPVSLVLKKRLR